MGSDLLGSVLGGRYIPRSVLGAGANAEVYLADDMHTGGSVALKALHQELRDKREARLRLDREGRIAGSLNHPNVCRVTDVGRLADESPFLVMELLVGESLDQRLVREVKLSVDEAVDITYQVLAGLGPAHRRGVVHRDLKPANVYLVPIGPRSTIAKVLDFGGAADAASFQEVPLTAMGLVVGTPLFMTPEQAMGKRDFDGRTDLYVCGTLLYVMLSGKLPFIGPNLRTVMEAIASSSPRPISALRPGLSRALVAVIERAMAHDRGGRYATAEEFQNALLAAISPDAARGQGESEPALESSEPLGLDAVTRRLSPADFRTVGPGARAESAKTTVLSEDERPDWDKTTQQPVQPKPPGSD